MSILARLMGAPTTPTMDENFEVLRKYGRTRLMQMDSGWHACIDVGVSTPGVKFEVATGFKHKTPAEALETLVALTLKAVTTIGETT